MPTEDRNQNLAAADARSARTDAAGLPLAQFEAVALGAERHEEERRQLTMVFCDLIGSTTLSERLDPEDLSEVIRGYQQCCTEVAAKFGGYVAQFQGDGILIYFGYPKADEHSVERAVRCSLATVEAVTALKLPFDVQLHTRVGIATGIVVMGSLPGDGPQHQFVFGETPNLAARLQSLADSDTVVVSHETKLLLGQLFVFRDLGEHAIRGFTDPVRTWQVVAEARYESRFETIRDPVHAPFFGRCEELDAILEAWEHCKRGIGQAFQISGEAGIGKSRFVYELRNRLNEDEHTEIQFNCSPYHTNTDLYPVIEWLKQSADIDLDKPASDNLANLESFLKLTWNDVSEIAPLFADLLSIPTAKRYALALSPQQRKERLLRALVELFTHTEPGRPTLLIFEDTHWIDPTSMELLDVFVEGASELGALVIITQRSDDLPLHSRPPNLCSIHLLRLTKVQSAALAAGVAAGKGLPPEILDRIIARADGVPLFLEELTRIILHSDLLDELPDRYVLKSAPETLSIPSTIRDSLMARLDQLGKAKRVAQIGAVIGREFSTELLVAIWPQADVDLGEALLQLTQSGLISERSTGSGPGYQFKHALVQEAAYESLLKRDRRLLHTKIAATIEERLPAVSKAEPELLAHHYTLAGDYELAMAYATAAAQRALQRSAHLEVVGHVQKGLALLRNLPESRERDTQELNLQILLGAAYRATKGFASVDVELTFVRARDLCQRVERKSQFLDVMRGLASCYYIRGDLGAAREIAEDFLTASEADRNVQYLMLGHYIRGSTLFWHGDFQHARQELEEALELDDPTRIPAETLSSQIDPGTFARIHLSWTLWFLGYADQANQAILQAIEKAQRLAQPFTLSMALTWACWLGRCCGDSTVTARHLGELTTLTREHRFAYLGACADYLKGQLWIEGNQVEAGIETTLRALGELREQNARLGWPWMMALPAQAFGQLGSYDQGLRMIAEALDLCQRNGEHHWKAELYRLKGELLRAREPDQYEQAKICFEKALQLSRKQGARALELRAAMSLSALHSQKQDKESARRCLDSVLAGFTEGFETLDLTRAARMLGDLA